MSTCDRFMATHHTGCDCWEEAHRVQLARLVAERDEARAAHDEEDMNETERCVSKGEREVLRTEKAEAEVGRLRQLLTHETDRRVQATRARDQAVARAEKAEAEVEQLRGVVRRVVETYREIWGLLDDAVMDEAIRLEDGKAAWFYTGQPPELWKDTDA